MPENPKIKRITLPSGTTYDITDQGARDLIAELMNFREYLGVTTTPLTSGSTTNPIMIEGEAVTAQAGDVATYNTEEFVFSSTNQWQQFGSLTSLGALAYKNSASGNFTPAGGVTSTWTGAETTSTGSFTPSGAVTISKAESGTANYTPEGSVSSTFTGASMTSTGKFTPNGNVSLTTEQEVLDVYGSAPTGGQSATYTPAGSIGLTTRDLYYAVNPTIEGSGDAYTPAGNVAAPTISVATAGSTTTVNSITSVGTLPELTATVSNEVLTIGFNQGTLPTKGSDTTVKTGDAAYSATAPSFTGTPTRFQVNVPTVQGATFTGTGTKLTTSVDIPTSAGFSGTEGNVSVTGTTGGSVSSSFNGTGAVLTGSFEGTDGTVTVKGTPQGSVNSTFNGTQGTVTVS